MRLKVINFTDIIAYMKHTLLLLLCSITIAASAQTKNDAAGFTKSTSVPAFKQHNLLLQRAAYAAATPHTGTEKTTSGTGPVFDTTQWNHRVDSTWGAGWPDSVKLSVLNMFWGHIDSLYPCFVHLPSYNWDSIVSSMQAQITAGGVSEGKYASMINYLLSLMNDGHSNFYDYMVNYPYAIYPGLPLFRGESGKLGACVTTLNDTTALVYSAFPGHPFGLEPGDIILGYNGIPWTRLVQIILGYNLPNSVYKGSTDSAMYHRYIQAAGENWYLFDTINIKKCNGSLVNLPTSLMSGVLYNDFCTEQMDVPGVNKPSYNGYYYDDSDVVYGVMTGTHIGYVYMYDCEDTTDKLYRAVKSLVEDSMVTGLILDIRTNFGGGFDAYWDAYTYLTSGGTSWVGYGQRSDPTNRLAMYIDGPTSWYDIVDSDPNYFPHPIAILCGPNAVSAGDFLPVMFQHNPQVKLFGKSTAGAFGNLVEVNVNNTNFATTMQQTNFFQASDPSNYISHTMIPVNFPVWLDQAGVCAGTDTVVNTAAHWIEGTEAVKNATAATVKISVFPNPATKYIDIAIASPANDQMDVKLCDMLGEAVNDNGYSIVPGNNSIRINLENTQVPSGNYYLSFQGNNGERTIRKIAIIR